MSERVCELACCYSPKLGPGYHKTMLIDKPPKSKQPCLAVVALGAQALLILLVTGDFLGSA